VEGEVGRRSYPAQRNLVNLTQPVKPGLNPSNHIDPYPSSTLAAAQRTENAIYEMNLKNYIDEGIIYHL
jgi:hypothetical protein